MRLERIVIPGANLLADVASEDVALERHLRQWTAMLNRRVTDAVFRCDGSIRQDRVCRTRVETFRARAAAVSDFCRFDVILERGEQRADEKIRAMLLVNQHAVLSD